MRKTMGHRGFSEGNFIRVPLVAGHHEGAAGWLSPTLRKCLGDQLRRHYGDLEAAPLPADMAASLARLDKHAAVDGAVGPPDPASVVS